MKSITISLPHIQGNTEYQIFFGLGAFARLSEIIDFKKYSSTLFIYDANVKKNWSEMTPSFASESVMPAGGEKQKRVDILHSLWELFLHKGLDRHSLVVSVGGGALCDVAAFAASTYMRGVSFINVPTTLLSMVDSSIGGKNGINVGSVKNLVGTFAQPQAVIIDPLFLGTLPSNELVSGYAEVIKHGLITDPEFFKEIAAKPVQKLLPEELLSQIEHSCRIKAAVVMEDPFEQNIRKILNFGHTIGHAYEALSHENGATLLHGEAIALGMLAECEIGVRVGLGSETITDTLRTLLVQHGLPIKAPSYAIEEVMDKVRVDKKNRGGKLMFSLISSIGRCEVDREISENIVLDVLASVMK